MAARASKLLGSTLLLVSVATPFQSAAQSAPADNMVATRYDVARRVTGTISPDPDGTGPIKFAATRNTYNSRGLLITVESGELAEWQSEEVKPLAWSGLTVFQRIDTTFDVMGRKVKDVVTAGGAIQGVTQYSYTAAGDLECTAIRMNAATFPNPPASACSLGTQGTQGKDRITRNVYYFVNRLQKVQRAYGTPLQQDYVAYTYTLNGKPSTVTDANGTTAAYHYDGHDRLKRWHFPSKTTAGVSSDTDYEEYGYDVAGRRTSLRKRDGSILTFNYDALNRITSKIVPARTGLAATHTRDVYYGYDLRGLQLFARFDSASGEGLSFTYDNHSRVTGTTQAINGTTRALTYQWDANSLRTRVTHADGAYVQYGYDGLDRPLTISSGTTQILSQGYNAKGEVTGRSLIGGVATALTYDALSRPATMTHDLAGTNGDIAYGYGYNRAGQMTSRSRNNDAYIYGGDVNVARNYTVNGLNQYTATSTGAAFCYDQNGNLTADGVNVYLYDIENRLVEARAQQSGACPTTTSGYGGVIKATLRYDPLGRLYETGGGSAGITRFLYDGDELVGEYNSAGTTLRRYAHGAGTDDPVAWYEGAAMSSGRQMLLADHQGSIVSMANESGVLVGINSYDDWGVPDAGNGGRFQYTGQAWLPELGMYHYKARVYSPTLGRFLQSDPIGYADNLNLYAYVGNDAVNGIDPTGAYECKEKECREIDRIRNEIIKSRRSDQLNAARNSAIGSLLRTLGTKNDRNGVQIFNATLSKGTFGETTQEGNGYTIKLDFNQIRYSTGNVGRSAAAATLAHEVRHVQQGIAGYPIATRADITLREIGAYRAGAIVLQGLGVSGASMPSYLDPRSESRIYQAAKDNCLNSAFPDSGKLTAVGALPGSCILE